MKKELRHIPFTKSSLLAHINENWVKNNMIDRQTLVGVLRSDGFL